MNFLKTKQRRKPFPPHWYEIYLSECVCCGQSDDYRERRLGEKPIDRPTRHFNQELCYNCRY